MNEPLGGPALAASVWRDFLRARWALFGFEVLFKLFEAWLFVPAVGLVLSVVLSRAGHVAVSNRDVLDFLLTPLGLVYAALFGAAGAAVLLFEQAGIMVLVARAGADERTSVARALFAAPLEALRIARLGATKVALLALTFLPFVVLALLSYGLFLSRHDINFYLAERPPRFWLAVGAGVLLVLAASVVGVVLFVRWAFALPILLFERQPARDALRASGERVRGTAWRVGFVLVGWQAGVYERDVKMTSFWQNDGIVWEEGVKEMHLVMKDDSGGGGHAHKRPDPEKFFPTRVRITMIQVAKGAKYDPKLVPNLPENK